MAAIQLAAVILFIIVLIWHLMKSQSVKGIYENFVSSAVTQAAITITCPPGYKFYTDPAGKSFCCSGTVDVVEGTCTPTKKSVHGLSPLCSLSGKTQDENGNSIPYCGKLIIDMLKILGARDCPPNKAYRATDDGEGGFCCNMAPSFSLPGVCPTGARTCRVEPGDEILVGTCQAEKLESSIRCPRGMDAMSGRNITSKSGKEMPLFMCVEDDPTKGGYCFPEESMGIIKGAYPRFRNFSNWENYCPVYQQVHKDKSRLSSNTTFPSFS